MSDQDVDGFVPVPVPLGDGRHDIGDERRAAIVQRLISDWSHDPDLPPEKVRQLAMWAAASVRALFHELGTLQDTMTPAATSPDVAALDAEQLEQRLRHGAYLTWDELVALATAAADALAATRQVLQPPDVAALDAEKLVERYCRFNCDLESSCRCAVHEVYRALHAELLTTQQWARAEHMDVLRLEAYQAATRAALQRVEQERDALREQAQLYIDQREMTLAAKRETEARLAQVEAALSLAESVYRQNCVNPGEPSSVLDAIQAALGERPRS